MPAVERPGELGPQVLAVALGMAAVLLLMLLTITTTPACMRVHGASSDVNLAVAFAKTHKTGSSTVTSVLHRLGINYGLRMPVWGTGNAGKQFVLCPEASVAQWVSTAHPTTGDDEPGRLHACSMHEHARGRAVYACNGAGAYRDLHGCLNATTPLLQRGPPYDIWPHHTTFVGGIKAARRVVPRANTIWTVVREPAARFVSAVCFYPPNLCSVSQVHMQLASLVENGTSPHSIAAYIAAAHAATLRNKHVHSARKRFAQPNFEKWGIVRQLEGITRNLLGERTDGTPVDNIMSISGDDYESLLASLRSPTLNHSRQGPETSYSAFVLERMHESMALFGLEHRLSPFDIVHFEMKTKHKPEPAEHVRGAREQQHTGQRHTSARVPWGSPGSAHGSQTHQQLARLLRQLQPHDEKLYDAAWRQLNTRLARQPLGHVDCFMHKVAALSAHLHKECPRLVRFPGCRIKSGIDTALVSKGPVKACDIPNITHCCLEGQTYAGNSALKFANKLAQPELGSSAPTPASHLDRKSFRANVAANERLFRAMAEHHFSHAQPDPEHPQAYTGKSCSTYEEQSHSSDSGTLSRSAVPGHNTSNAMDTGSVADEAH